jgi:tRNA G18 (ribose-2'-O)-methylase SpoU
VKKIKNNELNRLSVEDFKSAQKTQIIIVLDNVRSLNNIGSIFRTADAFLIDHIYLCGITATPPNKDIQKTALGSTDSISWSYEKDTLSIVKKLQSKKIKVIAVEQVENSVMLQDFKTFENDVYALVFGHEVKGVSQEVVSQCDMAIEIPQYGTKHSFNISVSCGIVLWELFSKINYS